MKQFRMGFSVLLVGGCLGLVAWRPELATGLGPVVMAVVGYWFRAPQQKAEKGT